MDHMISLQGSYISSIQLVATHKFIISLQLSEVMGQLRDAQEQIQQVKNNQSNKTRQQEIQLATAEGEIKQLKQNHSHMTATLASLQAELQEAHARESKLKVTC